MNPGEFRAQASLFALQCSGTSFLRAAVRAVRATRDVHRDICCLPFRLPFCSPFVVWWCIAGGGAGTRPCPHQDHLGGCLHAGDASNEAHQHADYPGEKTLNACVCVCLYARMYVRVGCPARRWLCLCPSSTTSLLPLGFVVVLRQTFKKKLRASRATCPDVCFVFRLHCRKRGSGPG